MDNKKRYTLEEVKQMDDYLLQLAAYDVSNGMLKIPKYIDDAIEIQNKIIKRFNYFKRLIRNGSCSFEFIEQTTLYKNGPFEQPKIDDTDPDYIEKMLKEQEQFGLSNSVTQNTNNSSNHLEQIISLLLDETLNNYKSHEKDQNKDTNSDEKTNL
jgi:hypothetical protein